jgi:hypothetical protein
MTERDGGDRNGGDDDGGGGGGDAGRSEPQDQPRVDSPAREPVTKREGEGETKSDR